jgi:hypothetical protein
MDEATSVGPLGFAPELLSGVTIYGFISDVLAGSAMITQQITEVTVKNNGCHG